MATPTFSLGVIFMMDLGKPKLPTKFEVTIFSRSRNSKGKPHWGGPLAQCHTYFRFASAWDFMMSLGKPQRLAKLKSLASSITDI